MKFSHIFSILVLALIGYYFYSNGQARDADAHEQLQSRIAVQDQKIEELKTRLDSLERPRQVTPPQISTPTLPLAQQRPTPRPTPTPQGRLIDVPGGSGSCDFARINSNTRLATSLTWDPSNGGTFVGDLPKGSVVEVLNTTLHIWSDFPNEHGLFVRVIESPTAPRMEGQSGYIELRRIGHKRCNLGAEFEQ